MRPAPHPHSRASELAGALLDRATHRVERLVGDVAHELGSRAALRRVLLEPTARLLGERWEDDRCSEAEIVLALCALLAAARGVNGARSPARPRAAGRVLVALLPGETHLLGAALASDELYEAGWSVVVAFPSDTAALSKQLRTVHFDTLHLSLSDAFRRDDSLSSLARTIKAARAASCNLSLRITVGGSAFADGSSSPQDVDADALLSDES